ncbi:MAG: hypothetical protein NVV59_00290 [Chitinophagaceae bacterium]|nr:hypothetical protein [Chitinophagaceae bacterium]
MKVTGIVFIVVGILAIVFNLIMIPEMKFSQTGDDAYDTGYNIGLFLIAIIGFMLFIIGLLLSRSAARKEKADMERKLQQNHQYQQYQQYQQQQQYYQQPPQQPQQPPQSQQQPPQPPRPNTY